ncbi:MAG: Holliday junction resolvase RuvX [Acidobacteriota bacterium]
MALDLGEVRIGVALSDPLRLTARALTTLKHRNPDSDLSYLHRLVEEHEVAEIVVGYPLRLSGERGRAALAAERFAQRLGERLQVPVKLWDERWTTREAERVLLEMNLSRRRRRQTIDGVTAALILQAFLDFERHAREAQEHRGVNAADE